ncbi:MAG: hypothetical protein U0792_10020 [Gemmataceae bacterium]
MPEGFKVTLFAGEPDIAQPIAFTFDDRGRMRVVECLSYPKWSKDGKGSDRVVILEDTGRDGTFNKKTEFITDGVNLSGIELGFGGVWLCPIAQPRGVRAHPRRRQARQLRGCARRLKYDRHEAQHLQLARLGTGWLASLRPQRHSSEGVGWAARHAEGKTPIHGLRGVAISPDAEDLFEPVAHGTTNLSASTGTRTANCLSRTA